MKITISLGQMDVILGDPVRNLDKVQQMTAEASRRGSDLILFPELWASGYDLDNIGRYATSIDQGVFAETADLARQYGLHILGSNLSIDDQGRYGNTAVLFGPHGKNLGSYSKIHLFGPMEEDKHLEPGDVPGLVDSQWGKTGLAICYDLRFPELFRAYGVAGANLILLPAEWPYPRIAHWRTLIKARAIENQLFVAACNRVGESGDARFFGHSMIVNPEGNIILEGGEEEMLLTASIDLDQIEQTQALFDILNDRRPEAYKAR